MRNKEFTMKIVIQTQIRENYGAHDWDGKGECPQRWKFKGGDTYVVPNLTPAQAARVQEEGIPTLTALIESRSEGFEEYILGFSVAEDSDAVCEPWETPFELFWEQNRWVARRVVKNDEYGYMRREVAAKTEEYVMHMGGERADYQVMYTLRDGRVLNNDDTVAALAA
jgi:hypothetical protein